MSCEPNQALIADAREYADRSLRQAKAGLAEQSRYNWEKSVDCLVRAGVDLDAIVADDRQRTIQ
jgi:hypothetical protein